MRAFSIDAARRASASASVTSCSPLAWASASEVRAFSSALAMSWRASSLASATAASAVRWASISVRFIASPGSGTSRELSSCSFVIIDRARDSVAAACACTASTPLASWPRKARTSSGSYPLRTVRNWTPVIALGLSSITPSYGYVTGRGAMSWRSRAHAE
jgi:hypothetical protein